MLQDIFAHRDAVAAIAIDGERADVLADVLGIGRAAARLVPLDDGVILLPGRKGGCRLAARRARPAMQDEKHGVARVTAADGDPLLYAVDRHEHAFVDRLRRWRLFHVSTPGKTPQKRRAKQARGHSNMAALGRFPKLSKCLLLTPHGRPP